MHFHPGTTKSTPGMKHGNSINVSSNSRIEFDLYFLLQHEPKCQAGLAKHAGEGLFSNLWQQRGLCSLYCPASLFSSPSVYSSFCAVLRSSHQNPPMCFCIQCIVSSNSPLACLSVLITDDPRTWPQKIYLPLLPLPHSPEKSMEKIKLIIRMLLAS